MMCFVLVIHFLDDSDRTAHWIAQDYLLRSNLYRVDLEYVSSQDNRVNTLT